MTEEGDHLKYEDKPPIEEVLEHHGIKGQRWGIRRTPEQLGRLSKKDERWVNKKSDKIMEKAEKQSSKELQSYAKQLVKNPNAYKASGKLSAATINAYNQKMAELMSKKVSDIRSPSGKVVNFVAKRGEIGVMMALSDQSYNIEQLKKGVWASGRVAYKKNVLDKYETGGR